MYLKEPSDSLQVRCGGNVLCSMGSSHLAVVVAAWCVRCWLNAELLTVDTDGNVELAMTENVAVVERSQWRGTAANWWNIAQMSMQLIPQCCTFCYCCRNSAVAEALADVCEHYSEAVNGTSQMLTRMVLCEQTHMTHSMISFNTMQLYINHVQ